MCLSSLFGRDGQIGRSRCCPHSVIPSGEAGDIGNTDDAPFQMVSPVTNSRTVQISADYSEECLNVPGAVREMSLWVTVSARMLVRIVENRRSTLALLPPYNVYCLPRGVMSRVYHDSSAESLLENSNSLNNPSLVPVAQSIAQSPTKVHAKSRLRLVPLAWTYTLACVHGAQAWMMYTTTLYLCSFFAIVRSTADDP